MTYTPHPRDRRQMAYIERSKTARLYAKFLMPVTMIVLSAGIWSDPVLNPRLMQGLEEIKPMVEAVMAGEPIGEVFALSRAAPEPEAEAAEEDPARPGLPASNLTVNRPSG